MSSSTPDNRCFPTGCHRAASLGDFCDTPSSRMAWEGARRLAAVEHPAPADHDDTRSSCTALTGFSYRASSRTASARLFLLRVVKHRRHVCMTTRCRRARLFVVYDDTVPLGEGAFPCFPASLQIRLWEPNNRFTGSFSWINPYRRQFFLIKCCHRVLSGIFSVIITAASVLLGVYQAFPAKHRPDARSIVLSAVRV